MKKVYSGIFLPILIVLSLDSHAIEPIKVLLAKTSSSTVSPNDVRLMLSQLNGTMSMSGLASNDFHSASFSNNNPEVHDVICPGTDSVALNLCARSKLSGKRNEVNADIVLMMAPTVVGCGGTLPGMINAPTIGQDNQNLAYAVVSKACFIAATRGQQVASHEVSHLLSIEHHDGDQHSTLPVLWTANHAAEDFDDFTVGAGAGDCLWCDWHNWFSQDGRKFPDNGDAGDSDFSNAKDVIAGISWNAVASYRPLPAVKNCRLQWELAFCNGQNGVGTMTALLPGYTVTSSNFDISLGGGPWNDIFDGVLTCPGVLITPQYQTVVRAILQTPQGISQCSRTFALPINCGGGGGGGPPNPY